MFYQFFQRLSQNLIIYVFGTFLLLLLFLFSIGVIKGNLFFLHPKDLTSGGFWLLFLRLFFLLHFLELFPLFLNIKLLSFDLFLFLMKTDLQLIEVIKLFREIVFVPHAISQHDIVFLIFSLKFLQEKGFVLQSYHLYFL